MTAAAETQNSLSDKGVAILKSAPWASAIPSQRVNNNNTARYSLPQTISHRGYKAVWPENSMAAFRGAVEAGTDALETDVHLSKDGVVVLSHDPSLKRCFGVDRKIADCDWEYLSSLKTLQAPHEGLPKLSDLLEYLVSGPETEKIWVLLDIKIDDDAQELLGAIAKTFTEVSSPVPWDERFVLGCWNATFTKTAVSLLPGFPLAHISFSTSYSRHFLSIPSLGFNMAQRLLVGPFGSWFLQDAKKAGRQVFTWTVNEEEWMEWCIRKNTPSAGSSAAVKESVPVLIDGVCTDDPKLFRQVLKRIEDEIDGTTAAAATAAEAKPLAMSSSALTQTKNLSLVGTLRARLGMLCNLLFINAFGRGFFLYRRLQGRFDKFDSKFLRALRAK